MTYTAGVQYKNRILWVDVAKGLGIILVVLGHGLLPHSLHLLIDGFHMPLFFILSGFTFCVASSPLLFIRKKISRILVPYLLWYMLSVVLNVENGPLWFLRVLFISLVLCYFLIKWIPNLLLLCIMVSSSLFIWGRFSIINLLPLELGRCLSSVLFIYCGYVIRKALPLLSKYGFLPFTMIKSHTHIKLLCALSVALLYIIFNMYGQTHGLYREISFRYLSMFKINYLFILFLTLLGSFSTFFFAAFLEQNRVLQWFGSNSIIIMCVHFPMCSYFDNYITMLPQFGHMQFIYKILCASLGTMTILSLSAIMALFCNRYFPILAGKSRVME